VCGNRGSSTWFVKNLSDESVLRLSPVNAESLTISDPGPGAAKWALPSSPSNDSSAALVLPGGTAQVTGGSKVNIEVDPDYTRMAVFAQTLANAYHFTSNPGGLFKFCVLKFNSGDPASYLEGAEECHDLAEQANKTQELHERVMERPRSMHVPSIAESPKPGLLDSLKEFAEHGLLHE
jgi:hypothetical protein